MLIKRIAIILHLFSANAMKLLAGIKEAFAHRGRPARVVPKGHADTHEYKDASHFSGRDWESVVTTEWAQYSDAIYAFTPEAFCYFLPSILCAGPKDKHPELLVNDIILGILDRSPTVAYWDQFFIERWPLLTQRECQCAQDWTLWLSEANVGISDDSLTRAYETLDILSREHGAFVEFQQKLREP